MFKPISLYYTDGYKVGHKRMLAPGTDYLAGSWIPRTIKYAPKGIEKITSFGQQLTMRWLNDEFRENFFNVPLEAAQKFGKDMSAYLMQPYDAKHFEDLHKLGYLPIKVKAIPEGIETFPNIPHMTFINTVKGYAWLTLYLETIISSLAWKPSTSATIARQYKKNAIKWVTKTDPSNLWLTDFMCHDFSARGLSPWDMLSSGLGHATSHKGSDTLIIIPGARYFYNEGEDDMPIFSVNASEHSVSTTKIFTVGEKQMILDWLKEIPEGIFSMVADTFSLWEFIQYLKDPEVKTAVLARTGKLVVRPDSGNPVDIICGLNSKYIGKEFEDSDGAQRQEYWVTKSEAAHPSYKGVIELLWDIFGGTVNEQGYKVLDPHIGAIYGDSINIDRQVEIYERLAAKGFAATNIVLGVGSFTYQMNTRDTLGFAAKGTWFQANDKEYNIYKDPVTDDGSKKSLKGLLAVLQDEKGEYYCKTECTHEEENSGVLQTIFQDGKFFNQISLTEIRAKIN